MKILQVIPYFVPAWDYGGPVSSVYNISKELVKRGHSVTVYTTDTLNSEERIKKSEETIDGIKVMRFKNWSNSIANKHKVFLSLGVISSLRNNLKEFDLVHTHEYRTFQNIFIHRYALKHHIPYILQARGSLPKIIVKQRLKQIYDILWGYKLLKDASTVIALTPTEAEQYKNMGVSEDKIEIVPNGINPSEFEKLPPTGEFRKRYGLNDDQKIILYLGRIHKIKGLDLLAKAFADLSKEFDNVRLVIAGPDDGYLSVLIQLMKELHIEEKVLFTGPLFGKEKLKAYVDADIYVLPSTYEIFGITVLEALACGTPVIVSERCGIAYWVNEAVYVIQYEEEQLREALAKVLVSEEHTTQLKNKRRLLARNFTWSKVGRRLENIYQGLEAKDIEEVSKSSL